MDGGDERAPLLGGGESEKKVKKRRGENNLTFQESFSSAENDQPASQTEFFVTMLPFIILQVLYLLFFLFPILSPIFLRPALGSVPPSKPPSTPWRRPRKEPARPSLAPSSGSSTSASSSLDPWLGSTSLSGAFVSSFLPDFSSMADHSFYLAFSNGWTTR